MQLHQAKMERITVMRSIFASWSCSISAFN